MAPLQDIRYLENILHLIHDSPGGYLSFFSSTSSLWRSNTTFDTGLSTVLLLSTRSTLQIFNLTLRTNPLSSQYVCVTLKICQSFLMVFASCKITISPTFKFLLVFVHFFLSWIDCNSFLQWQQNSFTMCWTCLHLLQLYKSGLEKSPGDGKVISLISWLKDLMETGASRWFDF